MKQKKLLERDVRQISFDQGRARQAYQDVEEGMDQLVKDRAALEAAIAGAEAVFIALAAPTIPALPQSRNERQQFRILMNGLDEVREIFELLFPGGVEPADLPHVRWMLLKKQQIDRCRQWLEEIDRPDYYEEAVAVRFDSSLRLSDETRLSEETHIEAAFGDAKHGADRRTAES
jgi:hypothetical protein